jgi:chorismate dehydratase
LLFSSKPIEALTGKTIGVTEETSTSYRLLRLLLERRHGLSGLSYHRGSHGEARLLIGDAALEEVKKATWPFVYDLAEQWQRWRQSPFVFARWVVRRSLPAADKAHFLSLIGKTYNRATANLEEVAAHCVGQGSLQKEEILVYLQNLVFLIGSDEERGLAEFRRLLVGESQSAESTEQRAV